eukprot:8762956-Pyramimonas_sp.AAC.1
MDAVGLPGDTRVLDKARTPSMHGGGVARAPYVDNGNMVSLSADAISARLAALTAELDRRGLRWHEL